jgi:hypothetical protein
MISLPRVFISFALYAAYIFAIIAITDPQQNTALYLILLAFGSVLFLWGMFSGFLLTSGKYRRLKTHGVEAAATILAVSDTGVTLNKNPYVKLRLRVEPIGMPAYETEAKAMVPRVAIRVPAMVCA